MVIFMILNLQKFILVLFLLCSLQLIAFAQYEYESASVLLATKQAKLVVIGEVSSLLREYSKPKENESKDDIVGDFSQVDFRVLEVLKGNYSKKDISVLYASHMGFESNSKWILVLFDTPSNLMAEYERKIFKLPLCKTQVCYASSSSWLFPATRNELLVFRGFLNSLNINEKPKKIK